MPVKKKEVMSLRDINVFRFVGMCAWFSSSLICSSQASLEGKSDALASEIQGVRAKQVL